MSCLAACLRVQLTYLHVGVTKAALWSSCLESWVFAGGGWAVCKPGVNTCLRVTSSSSVFNVFFCSNSVPWCCDVISSQAKYLPSRKQSGWMCGFPSQPMKVQKTREACLAALYFVCNLTLWVHTHPLLLGSTGGGYWLGLSRIKSYWSIFSRDISLITKRCLSDNNKKILSCLCKYVDKRSDDCSHVPILSWLAVIRERLVLIWNPRFMHLCYTW